MSNETTWTLGFACVCLALARCPPAPGQGVPFQFTENFDGYAPASVSVIPGWTSVDGPGNYDWDAVTGTNPPFTTSSPPHRVRHVGYGLPSSQPYASATWLVTVPTAILTYTLAFNYEVQPGASWLVECAASPAGPWINLNLPLQVLCVNNLDRRLSQDITWALSSAGVTTALYLR